jgi:murein DD-endopeptidase MepM/ murein hydrolase activator NlpD
VTTLTAGGVRRAPVSRRSERRVVAGQALLALLVAALGLVVAAALPLSTSASTTTRPVVAAPNPAQDAGRPARSAALRTALLREVAAQRAEQLAQQADRVEQTSRAAAGAARQQQLTAAEQATQSAAAKVAAQVAAERLRQAMLARQAAEQASSTDGTPTADPTTLGTVPAGTGGVLPVPSGVVGAHFGQYGSWSRYHTGLDFRAAYGTPIRAVLGGVVLYAGNSGDWAGNHVAVRHADGQTSMYSHMSSMAARAGQSVQAGQVIGYVGQTGRAFGPHLHFELYPAGVKYGDVYKAIDPMPWLRSIGVQTR